MGEQNQYTAQELRETAESLTYGDDESSMEFVIAEIGDNLTLLESVYETNMAADMLRYSADTVERLEKVMEICKRVIESKKGKYGIVSYMTLCGVAEEILKASVGNDGKQK